ncbi:hypothetical protein BC834DRAFT_912270 [Gloeopeniophorella convolvens]|nr:hypothetical protein BC834DRAFT_912270 [Gloeopeniophorella convolvens]
MVFVFCFRFLVLAKCRWVNRYPDGLVTHGFTLLLESSVRILLVYFVFVSWRARTDKRRARSLLSLSRYFTTRAGGPGL